MNQLERELMLDTLHEFSWNKPSKKGQENTTPAMDERSMISQIDVCYSIEYYNFKVKTFWESKKAYTYPIKHTDIDKWIELMVELPTLDDNEIYRHLEE